MSDHTITNGHIDPLWTLDDLADYLQVPKDTIRTWGKHGDGPRAYKVGRHVRFKYSDVNTWLDSREAHGACEAVYDPASDWEDLR